MSKPKRTPWFSVGTPPVRPGVYEVRYRIEEGFTEPARVEWLGGRWETGITTPSGMWGDQWRGLTAPAA